MKLARLLAALTALLTLSLHLHAAPASYIPEMEYLRLAPDASVTASEVMASDQWQRLPDQTPNFGYIRDQIWLRFPVTDASNSNLLEISYPQLDAIGFYLFKDNRLLREVITGDRMPFAERPVQHPHFLFPLQLAPGGNSQVLLRIQTEGAMQAPLRLWNNRSYFEKASVESQLHAVYYGILIAVICFNLFVFIALKEAVYLFYVLSTLGYLLLVGGLNGITYQLLWPESPTIQNRAMAMIVPLAMSCTLMFSRAFLRLKQVSPKMDRLVLAVLALNLTMAAANLFIDYNTGMRLSVALVIPSSLLLTFIGPLQWLRGNPQAMYYTLAWAALTLGSAITAANKYGWIPNSFITSYGMELGSALEAMLLSLALAIQIYRERQDRLHSREAELHALEARRNAELQMMDQALHNPLTGLPNRSSFELRVSELIRRNPKQRLGIAVIHLNNLYAVTKTLGHRNTDRILELTSRQFNDVTRKVPGIVAIEQSEGRDFYLASLDPQTFALISYADRTESVPRHVLRDIEVIRQPIDFLGMQIPLTPQLGVAIYPDHGTDVNTLIRRAVIAEGSERARERGVAYYKPSKDSYSAERLTLVSELRQALELNQLTLYLQPKQCLKSGDITGFEALIRWPDRERQVPPHEVIELAEQTGLIKPLTRWVLREALEIREKLAAKGAPTRIAVNISPNNLREPDFPVFVQRMMQSYQCPAGELAFEVTETSMMQDPANSLKALKAINAAGIPLSIDDFGSGYSSLSYIKQLPASEIKIDRSLITELAEREEDRVIVRTTIEMCHSLGYTVVAEGVESEKTLKLLESMGCDLVQGYILARPQPFDRIIDWLADQPCRSRINAS